eukprot:scaffold81385_cov45-Prasinocladus_malaysianus.AAC.1
MHRHNGMTKRVKSHWHKTISNEWSSTLAMWPKLRMKNAVLRMEDKYLWEGKKILFGRKFNPLVDAAVIRHVIHTHSPHVNLSWLGS